MLNRAPARSWMDSIAQPLCLAAGALALAACTTRPALTATPAAGRPLVPCNAATAPAPLASLADMPGSLYFLVDNDVVALEGTPPAERTVFSVAWTDDYLLSGLSPSGKWFLYGSFPVPGGSPNPLYLRSQQGEVLTRTFPAETPPNGSWVYAGWISDSLLLVHRYDSNLAGGFPYAVGLYDVAADTWTTALLDELPNRAVRGAVAIAPDLTRVVYVAEGEGLPSLVLWDLTRHQELWRRDDFATQSIIQGTRVGHFPVVWSADSARVAFSDWGNAANQFQGQVFVLDREGQQARGLTTARPGDLLSGLAWSPDGRYLAGVTLVHEQSPRNVIVVYDLTTGAGVDLCALPETSNPLNNVLAAGLVWSPDSSYLGYGVGPDSLSEANGVVVLNIHTGAVTLVEQGALVRLLGWTASTP